MRTPPAVLFAIPIIALLGVSHARPARADETVRATGCLRCTDGTGVTWPLAQTRIRLMDSDCRGSTLCDDEMVVGATDDQGCFDLTGRGGDGGLNPWARPDPYVQVQYQSTEAGAGKVRLIDDVGQTRRVELDQHGHSNVKGVVNFGVRLLGSNRGASKPTQCSTYLAAAREHQAHRSLGWSPPADVKVQYPSVFDFGIWASRDTVHWNDAEPWPGTLSHEFAHVVRHSIDAAGDNNHFMWDAVRFRYAREHQRCDSRHIGETHANRLGYAFNEGWAELWEGSVAGCGRCTNAGAPAAAGTCYRAADCDSASGAGDGVCDASDMTVEGNVARALDQLSRCPTLTSGQCTNAWRRGAVCDDDSDCAVTSPVADGGRCLRGASTFLAVLSAHAKAIHSFSEFEQRFTAATGCGVASTAVALTANPRRPEFVGAAPGDGVRRWRERMVALEAELTEARAAAALALTCGDDDCEASLQAAIRPALLEGALAAARLIAELPPGPSDPDVTFDELEATTAARAARFRVAAVVIERETLRRAIAATTRLADSHAGARAARAALETKLAAMSGADAEPQLAVVSALDADVVVDDAGATAVPPVASRSTCATCAGGAGGRAAWLPLGMLAAYAVLRRRRRPSAPGAGACRAGGLTP